MTFLLTFYFVLGIAAWAAASIEAIRWALRFRRLRLAMGPDWERAQEHLKYLFVLSRAAEGSGENRATGTAQF